MALCSSLVTLTRYDDPTNWLDISSLEVANVGVLRSLQIYGSTHGVSKLLICISAPNVEEPLTPPVAWENLHFLPHLFKFSHLKFLALGFGPLGSFDLTRTSVCFSAAKQFTLTDIHAFQFSDILTSPTRVVLQPWPQTLSLRNVDAEDEEVVDKVIICRRTAGHPRRVCLDSDTIHASPTWLGCKARWKLRSRTPSYFTRGMRSIVTRKGEYTDP